MPVVPAAFITWHAPQPVEMNTFFPADTSLAVNVPFMPFFASSSIVDW